MSETTNHTGWFSNYAEFDKEKCECSFCHRPLDSLLRRIKNAKGETIELHKCRCGLRWWVNLNREDDIGRYVLRASQFGYW